MMGYQPRIKVLPPSAFSFLQASRPRLGARRRYRENGAALVIVLMMTAVLTVLIVAFLASSSRSTFVSNADSTRLRTEQLAQTALHELVRNLQSEMFAGSLDPQGAHSQPDVPIDTEHGPGSLLFPATAQSSVPCVTQVGGPVNLLKWSSRDGPFYTDRVGGSYPFTNIFPPGVAASFSSTLDPVVGGGIVSSSRWNAPYLLSGAFPVPDWVLITQKGESRSEFLNSTQDPIVGRYAYMVYDEGGLVNVNVAGFPSKMDATDAATLRSKGTPRLLDLSPILAASGMSPPDATAFNDALVQWRDAGVFSVGSFPANFRSDLLMRPFVGPTRLLPFNRAFLSRRELIQMVLFRFPGQVTAKQKFLQFVGTFSRALDQPSLQPPQPGAGGKNPPPILPPASGGNDGAGWDDLYANHAQHLNPPFLQVRVKSPFVRIDGTQARFGQPLVFRRFPLSRLAEIQHLGVAAPGGRIERMFGLSRSKVSDPWLYRSGQTSILTLNEVANLPPAEAREPDFMELLKASMYAGALASGASLNSEAWKHSLDCAVVQIAANLIDQYDLDSFPTRIGFSLPAGVKTISGSESLPYLYGLRNRISVLEESHPIPPFVVGSAAPSPFTFLPIQQPGKACVWQRVELWNPHLSGEINGGAGGPSLIRLVVDSGGKECLLRAEQETPMSAGGLVIPGTASFTFASGPFFGEQWRLQCESVQPTSFYSPLWMENAASNSALNVLIGADNHLSQGNLIDAYGNIMVGVGVAQVNRIFSVGSFPKLYTVFPSRYRIENAPSIKYSLEYSFSDPSGEVWIPYDEKVCQLESEVYWDDSKNRLLLFSDPRAQRAEAVKDVVSNDPDALSVHAFFNLPGLPGTYPDADGVIRRASGAATPNALPIDEPSRPRILNRPFRSVGEMACAFSGNTWRQLDFSTPETGFAGLLDVFSIYEYSEPNSLISGLINLNTRHLPVLQGALLGTAATLMSTGSAIAPELDPDSIDFLSKALVARTAQTPLRNRSELAGRWTGTASSSLSASGTSSSSGFASDFGAMPGSQSILHQEAYRHVAARTLAEIGDTRVWNLLLDIVVQCGKYPNQVGAKPNLRNFIFEAEKRIWVHVALDRLTGELLDWQIEQPED